MNLIYAGRYTEICDYSWDDYKDIEADLPYGIWHVDTTAIPEFFSAIQNKHNIEKRYVVVSPSCDFGVCLQKYNHPAYDIAKWAKLQISDKHGYGDAHIPARVNKDKCNIQDKYSIKCWSYTYATFPIIPNNVIKWFVVNCEIDDPRVVAIPFGVGGNKDNLDNVKLLDTKRKLPHNRTKLLYVNFQFYNTNRVELYTYFKRFDNVTCKTQVSFEEYLDDLATHKYVLCPTGNGWDCYRTLETIYMGAIPLLETRIGAVAPYMDLEYPMLLYYNLLQVNLGVLQKTYDDIMNINTNLEKAMWPYWKERIIGSYVY